jgi:ribosomal protein S1
VIEAIVLDLDIQNRRISLGLKQIEPNPWAVVAEKYPPGSIVTGVVRNLTDFGAFVELEEGIDGLVHISDMSWTTRVKHPSEVLKKGEEVQAVLLSIDVGNERLSLGIKQLHPNPWEGIADTITVGDVVTGKVVRLTDFGAFIELENGVEGLLHVSEISQQHIKKPEDVLSVGDEIAAKVIKLDEENRRIGLSIKAHEEETGKSAEAEVEPQAEKAEAEAEPGAETEDAESAAAETTPEAATAESAETTEASETPTESAEPAAEAPAEEKPAEETPSEEETAEKPPVAEAPAEEAPTEDAAAEETSAEEPESETDESDEKAESPADEPQASTS